VALGNQGFGKQEQEFMQAGFQNFNFFILLWGGGIE
jgi:hypothetical protein